MSTAEDLAVTLDHLRALVGFDTTNPPRRIDAAGIFDYLKQALGSSFATEVVDLGHGCVYLFARRGQPETLFNFHIDTVPVATDWSRDPFALLVTDDRAIGLGATDIKGAAACMLAALDHVTGDVALLFSSDEEGGAGSCVPDYIGRGDSYEGVFVAEPTRRQALIEHRGYVTASGVFNGRSGHSSASRALIDSAIHEAMRWGGAALAYADSENANHYGPLSGIRFNVGTFAGGIKPNMIADHAELRWAARPRPDQDLDAVVAAINGCADPTRVEWRRGFTGTPLPAGGVGEAERARARAAELGLEVATPADFWSEAALFSAAGYLTMVLGPGDIAQAHAADEWVALSELASCVDVYRKLLSQ